VIVEARSTHAHGAAAARRLRERACRYLSALGREDAEVSILVVDDAGIRRLNRMWRGKDAATDVLSFPQDTGGAAPLLGDLVISLDTARRVARRDRRRIGAELDRYLAHGLLHLLGHDHERPEDAARMAAAEDALVGEGMVAARRQEEARSERALGRARGRQGRGREAAGARGERGKAREPPTAQEPAQKKTKRVRSRPRPGPRSGGR
jgi:probable rRNA maturation factor